MADYPPPEIDRRLTALAGDLELFPAGAPIPWPLARVFNELLKQAKRARPEDPILRGLKLVEEADAALDAVGANALVGTVRGLIGQIRLALEAPSEPA